MMKLPALAVALVAAMSLSSCAAFDPMVQRPSDVNPEKKRDYPPAIDPKTGQPYRPNVNYQ